jgi:hypothetical protein
MLHSPLQTLLQEKSGCAATLAAAVSLAVARKDTDHAAFCGCVDWHSAVHGTWALVAYQRMTGDRQYAGLVARVLQDHKLDAERDLLRGRPGFEMPYGRAWLLRLAREHALDGGGDRLGGMAEEVLASMLSFYRGRSPDPRRGSYGSDSWALINMLEYAAWAGNAAALEAIRGWVEAHFVECEGACDTAPETGHFMAVATNWAWLVSKVLPQADFERWAEAFFAPAGLPGPVTAPVNWHHHGLNFSRAWGLWALYGASGPEGARRRFLDAYIAHFRAGYERPEHWRGDYRGVGHWVPQFGLLALQGLFAAGR